MAHRKNVQIKTRYRSLEMCMDSCRDIKKKRTLPIPASGKIYGEVFKDGSFILSSRKLKTSVIFEFVGHMEERDDGIYLVGDIRVKYYQKVLLFGFSLFFHLLGIIFLSVGTLGWVACGVFLMVVSWSYLFFMWKGDSLYFDLLRKVQ